jgi:dCMP deaminase
MILDKIPDGISWDSYFMSLAFLVSARSKDPSTKVGAVLVMDDKSIFTGYNGCPSNFNDEILSGPDKYHYVRHAEENALDFAGLERCRQQSNLTIYITFKPCPRCALKIAHFNVKNVIYYSEYKSGVNDDILVENIRNKGYTKLWKHVEVAFNLKKYEGDLLFSHTHMGLKR